MSTVPFNRARRVPLPVEISKQLPNNIDAEKNILGAVIVDGQTPNAQLKIARETLSPEDFFLEQNRRIFRNMLFLEESHQPIGIVSLVENLQKNRELDAAGGAPYIATLSDGMPRVSNTAYYCKVVKEKAQLRDLVYFTERVQHDALEGNASPEQLFAELETASKINAVSRENPAVVVSCRELLELQLPKSDPLIDPLLTRGGTAMMFSWAGLGKSWIATEMAYRIAQGIPTIFDGHKGMGGHWPLFGPLRTLYLYGEMHGERIRKRLMLIAKGNNGDMPESLGVMSKDYQTIPRAPRAAHSWRPCIGPDQKHRRYIEERIFGEGFQLLVLDNISTLWSAAQEEQSKQVAVLKEWFIDLNARGISVLFLQHAGKSGDFLGDSAQIHILDSVLKLTEPPGHKKKDGLRVILDVGKIRYEQSDPRCAVPFEASLVTSPEDGAKWLTRPAREAQKKAAFRMFKNKMPQMFVAQEVGVSKATVYRWKTEFDENPNVEFHDGQSDDDED